MLAAIKSSYVLLVPVTPSEVPNNSVFLDSTQGNQMAIKSNAGVVSNLTGVDNLMLKQMVIGQAITIHQPVAKLSSGKIVPAESDVAGESFIGYAQSGGTNDGDLINVLLIGSNVMNAIAGKGFTTGQTIYIDTETGEYTNDPARLSNPINQVIKVGIADCAASIASSTATDLISFVEKISDPT